MPRISSNVALAGVAILLLVAVLLDGRTESLVLIGLVFVSVVAILIGQRLKIATAEKWGSYAQSVAVVAGVIAAIYLYVVERRSEPHADVTQTVAIARLSGSDAVAIEAYVTVKNLGTRLLKIDHLYSRIQAYDLRSKNFDRLADMQGKDYQDAITIGSGTPEPLFKSTELPWPQLKLFHRDVANEIEPGESDLITISFVLNCPTVRYVRVASDITKPQVRLFWERQRDDDSKHELAWKTRTVVDLSSACPEQAKEVKDA